MSYAPFAYALQRVRELVQDGAGSIRAITSTRFQGDLPEGLTAEEYTRRGIVSEIHTDSRWGVEKRHPSRLTIACTTQIHLVELTVTVARTLATPQQVSDTLRDAVVSLAAEDSGALQQVLEWPQNLSTTSDGHDTGLKGLQYIDSTPQIIGNAGQAQQLRTVQRFDATIVSNPAAS